MQDVPPKLDYDAVKPDPPKNSSDVFPTILFAYPAVPIAGFAFKIGVLFVLGGFFTPFVLLIAITGAAAYRRTDSFGVWVISIVSNAASAAFFVPLFIHLFF